MRVATTSRLHMPLPIILIIVLIIVLHVYALHHRYSCGATGRNATTGNESQGNTPPACKKAFQPFIHPEEYLTDVARSGLKVTLTYHMGVNDHLLEAMNRRGRRTTMHRMWKTPNPRIPQIRKQET